MKHSFTSDSKQEYRNDCIDFLRTHGKSLVRDDRFSGHWCELAGQTGILTLNTLLDSGLILPNQFIGVDRSPQVIEECEAKEPGARWLVGSLLEVLPSIDDVSVLNFDSYRECGSDELLFDLDGLLSTITRAIRKYGSFVLFLNADLDSTKTKKISSREALEKHTRLVCKTLKGWLPGRSLDPDYLLKGSEVLDSKYLGRIGDHYFIYRSKSHRMANLKLVFRLGSLFGLKSMKPSELSAELRHMAAALDNSKNPDRSRVASALKGLVRRIASGDISVSLPPDTLSTYFDGDQARFNQALSGFKSLCLDMSGLDVVTSGNSVTIKNAGGIDPSILLGPLKAEGARLQGEGMQDDAELICSLVCDSLPVLHSSRHCRKPGIDESLPGFVVFEISNCFL